MNQQLANFSRTLLKEYPDSSVRKKVEEWLREIGMHLERVNIFHCTLLNVLRTLDPWIDRVRYSYLSP